MPWIKRCKWLRTQNILQKQTHEMGCSLVATTATWFQIMTLAVIACKRHQVPLFSCFKTSVYIDQVLTPGSLSRLHARTHALAHTRAVTCRSGWGSLEHLAVSASAGCWLTGNDLMKHGNCKTLPCSCICCPPSLRDWQHTENRRAAAGPMDKKHQYGSLERTDWSRDTNKAGYLINNCCFIVSLDSHV